MDKQKIAKLTRYRRAVRASQKARESHAVARATWADDDWDTFFRLEKERMDALFQATTMKGFDHHDSLPSPILR